MDGRQAALAVAILSYMPLRLQNLATLTFGIHLFMGEGDRATSTLEVPPGEMKNEAELAFDIPPHVAKMLIEYRDRIAPKVRSGSLAAPILGSMHLLHWEAMKQLRKLGACLPRTPYAVAHHLEQWRPAPGLARRLFSVLAIAVGSGPTVYRHCPARPGVVSGSLYRRGHR